MVKRRFRCRYCSTAVSTLPGSCSGFLCVGVRLIGAACVIFEGGGEKGGKLKREGELKNEGRITHLI